MSLDINVFSFPPFADLYFDYFFTHNMQNLHLCNKEQHLNFDIKKIWRWDDDSTTLEKAYDKDVT